MAKALDLIGTASRTSSLKRWMLRHREEFAAKLAEAKPPDWHAITRILDAEGLTLTGDKPLNVQAVKVLWGRVSKEAARPIKQEAKEMTGPKEGQKEESIYPNGGPDGGPPGHYWRVFNRGAWTAWQFMPIHREPEPSTEPEAAPLAGMSWLEKLRKKKD